MKTDYVSDRLTAAKYAETFVGPTVKEALARDLRLVFVAAIVTYHLADYLAVRVSLDGGNRGGAVAVPVPGNLNPATFLPSASKNDNEFFIARVGINYKFSWY